MPAGLRLIRRNPSFAAAGLALLLAVLAAVTIPALRAAKVDPVNALRDM